MRIPKRFKLYAQTIEVEYDEKLLHRDDARGMAFYRDCKIKLQPACDANPIPQGQIEQTFCHELLHFLFNAAGYTEDRADEEKVDRLAHLLHQALETCEYE